MIQDEEITVESFFALLLLRLQNKIETDVPEIKWVDQDFGQLELPVDRAPVNFPCVLIDFLNTPYDQQSEHMQSGNVTIQIRLGFAPFGNSNGFTPAKYRQLAISYYDIEAKLYTVLQGFTADDIMQPLTRTLAASEGREDTYRVRVMNFTTWFQDNSDVKETVTISRPPVDIENVSV